MFLRKFMFLAIVCGGAVALGDADDSPMTDHAPVGAARMAVAPTADAPVVHAVDFRKLGDGTGYLFD